MDGGGFGKVENKREVHDGVSGTPYLRFLRYAVSCPDTC